MKTGLNTGASINTGLNINNPGSNNTSTVGNNGASINIPLMINKSQPASGDNPPGGIDPNR